MLQQQTLLAVLERLFPVKVSRLAIFSVQFLYVGNPERASVIPPAPAAKCFLIIFFLLYFHMRMRTHETNFR